ncbi:MAG: GYF domain-containing protein, partial [Polyangiaceae bacterium]
MKFLCDQCKAKYQIADEKVAGKTVRMKCRKCGHLIEVRAAVTETSVAIESSPPPAASPASGRPPPSGSKPASKPPPKPTGLPRPTGAMAGTPPRAPTGAKPAAKPSPPASALAGAFKSNVQKDDETSKPFEMSELAPDDTWYVAINGVPVGPIKISEVRRKASLGAVTDDSLVWQEGQDEWRPARQLPDLAAIIREAASGRVSLTPPPGRASTPPPRSSSLSPRPTGASGATGKMPRAPIAAAPAARNNVVPITSRLATAEKLDEPAALVGLAGAAAADPFAAPPPAAASAAIAPPG